MSMATNKVINFCMWDSPAPGTLSFFFKKKDNVCPGSRGVPHTKYGRDWISMECIQKYPCRGSNVKWCIFRNLWNQRLPNQYLGGNAMCEIISDYLYTTKTHVPDKSLFFSTNSSINCLIQHFCTFGANVTWWSHAQPD